MHMMVAWGRKLYTEAHAAGAKEAEAKLAAKEAEVKALTAEAGRHREALNKAESRINVLAANMDGAGLPLIGDAQDIYAGYVESLQSIAGHIAQALSPESEAGKAAPDAAIIGPDGTGIATGASAKPAPGTQDKEGA